MSERLALEPSREWMRQSRAERSSMMVVRCCSSIPTSPFTHFLLLRQLGPAVRLSGFLGLECVAWQCHVGSPKRRESRRGFPSLSPRLSTISTAKGKNREREREEANATDGSASRLLAAGKEPFDLGSSSASSSI